MNKKILNIFVDFQMFISLSRIRVKEKAKTVKCNVLIDIDLRR